jgi:2,4-dienoyl-CoA reductase-like NADH-dependent reductase (Old Yellow Enzyme family)
MPARQGVIKPENEGYYKEDARYYKEKISVPLILGGGIRSLQTAEKFLQEGICDFIAMSRPLICEPDLIRQWQNGREEPSACLSDNQCCLPARAGKGLYCLTRVMDQKKPANHRAA